jgi:SAM-dependent methyltransferase
MQSAADFWEERYTESEGMWSGKVNEVLADVAADLKPGTALDLACGEGADAVWLAQHGWQVTGVDLSGTAISRAQQAAARAGLTESTARFIEADLATWQPEHTFDLVTCSFLHAWSIELPRDEILRRATSFVAPGGSLLLTSHGAAPQADAGQEGEAGAGNAGQTGASRVGETGAGNAGQTGAGTAGETGASNARQTGAGTAGQPRDQQHEHSGHGDHDDREFPTPEQELATLEVAEDEWDVVICELRERTGRSSEGESITHMDAVVQVRRK